MPLLLHRAPRADHLVEGLAALLGRPLADPFARELVLVPAKGIERWLSQQLSHRLGPRPGVGDGVCAGVEFRSPGSLVAEVLGTREDDPWAPEVLTWTVLDVLDSCATEPWARTLGLHLGLVPPAPGTPEAELEHRRGRRWSTARRLAGLFASYAVQRPELLAAWEAGEPTDGTGAPLPDDLGWQPELWRRVLAASGEPSPVVRQRDTVARLRADVDVAQLPERFSLFGHTRIPATEVELLAALGAQRDVHLWLPHPSDALWRALADVSVSVPREVDDSHARAGHRLLVSLGRDVRELQRALNPVAVDCHSPAPSSTSDTLLGWLQQDIAANATAPGARVLREDDRSVQVHSCHGPARQVEVLREVLLGLLADDPDLEPRDILVMCPDIEAYAPLITAAFGASPLEAASGTLHPGHQLRVMLADRNLTQTNPLFGVVGQLLDVAGGRAEASRVLDLLTHDAVRRRFGLTEKDLETVAGWVEKAGIRWAFDAQHRAGVGLDGYTENSWRFGLDRVLTGVAVSDDADRWFGEVLPLDDVASTSVGLAGRLAECLDRLQQVADRLTGEQPVSAWAEVLTEGVELLTSPARGDEWQLAQVHRELGSLGEDGQRLRLADVRALMADRVAGRPSRASFRTGTLTICTMTPMRSVPHQVVCLLGLDDGVFPRAGGADGDDVLARRPLTGERDPRSEDRQLLLDAVLAVGRTLVITYSGRTETTGQDRPPAVPLQELLDALDDTVPGAARHVVSLRPLQAFHPDNFEATAPFSFDRQMLAGARALTSARTEPPVLADTVLLPREGDVDLQELVAFFKAPVKEFLRRRLDVVLPDEREATGDGIPVELDNLQRWAVGDRMLRSMLEGRSRDATIERELRRGELPPGKLGRTLAEQIAGEAEPVATMVDTMRAGRNQEAVDVDLDLGGGRRLTGTVTDVYGERLVVANYSKLGPKHWLDAWIPLLALSGSRPGRPFLAGAAARRGRVSWTAQPDATALLADLVAIYDAGMREPLPLALKAGFEWALARRRPETVRRHAAEKAWKDGKFPGECSQVEHVRVWGRRCPIDRILEARPHPGEEFGDETTRFGALALRLWTPMMERELGK